MIILVPQHVHTELTPRVQAIAPEVLLCPYAEDQAEVPHAAEAVAVLRWTAGKRYAGLVENGPHVRWLHTASAGTDHVITRAIAEKPGLAISDSGPAYEIAIAEFVLAWMLAVVRKLPTLWQWQQEKHWEWLTQDELWGKTVGIVGLGPIGRGVAARCKAFGMRTLGLRRKPEPVPSVDETLIGLDGLQRVLAESDFVVLAAALTGETRTLIGPAELAAMKPTTWLINIARGPMVDQDALLEALRSGVIAGACLDVFAQEPLPADHPFWEMPNVLIAPHSSSGWSLPLRERQKDVFLQNLARFVRNEPLQNVVNLSAGY